MSFLRKLFFSIALSMPLVLSSGVSLPYAAEPFLKQNPTVNKDAPTIAEAFLNEELVYKIGFWIFTDVAEGKLTLTKGENGDYIARLEAQTLGVIDKYVKSRKDTYVGTLGLAEGGKRFITKKFEKHMVMDGRARHSVTVIDYEKRTMSWNRTETGKEDSVGTLPLPPGVYVDGPLASFYNFRYGVYGPIKEGNEYKILTFPKEDRVPEIYLKIVPKDEMQRRVKKESEKRAADYLADVRIDKDLFGSETGDIEILFTDDMIPVIALAKDIMLFGDVKGRLTRMSVGMEMKKKLATVE